MRKRIFGLLSLVVFSLFGLVGCKSEKTEIVSTCYVGYDFSSNISKDLMSSSMLLKPGEELHDFSPSLSDIEKVLASKLFIYVGGESDEEWVEKQILPLIDKEKTQVISLMEVVTSKGTSYEEEDPESSFSEEEHDHDHEDEEHEEEGPELDEHVWNSISNAKLIAEEIYDKLALIDEANKDKYKENKDNLVKELNDLDSEIKDIVSKANKKTIIFADRFPLLYFVKEYKLEYDAAFKGCESAKEANPKTIESLIKKVVDNDIKVIFVIELSESKIANKVKEGVESEGKEVSIETFYTMHNVSKNDYEKGTSYVDFMKKNIEVLKTALR